jgi:hypothetical protein
MSASARVLSFASLFNLAASNAELPFTAVDGGGGRSYGDFDFVVDVAKTDCTSAKGSLRVLLASSFRLDTSTYQGSMSTENQFLGNIQYLPTSFPLLLYLLIFTPFFMTAKLRIRIPWLRFPFRAIEIHRGRIVVLNLIWSRFRLVQKDCTR